jgi:hypothetical protein
MEKTFALATAMPDLAGNGRLAIYRTLDSRVSYVIIKDDSFEWQNRAKQEVFRCQACKCFILPDEKARTKDGVRYHKDCKVQRKEKAAVEERPGVIAPDGDIPQDVSAAA